MKSIPPLPPSPLSPFPSPNDGPARITSNVVGIGQVIPNAKAASATSRRRFLRGDGGSAGFRRRFGVPADNGDCEPAIQPTANTKQTNAQKHTYIRHGHRHNSTQAQTNNTSKKREGDFEVRPFFYTPTRSSRRAIFYVRMDLLDREHWTNTSQTVRMMNDGLSQKVT